MQRGYNCGLRQHHIPVIFIYIFDFYNKNYIFPVTGKACFELPSHSEIAHNTPFFAKQ